MLHPLPVAAHYEPFGESQNFRTENHAVVDYEMHPLPILRPPSHPHPHPANQVYLQVVPNSYTDVRIFSCLSARTAATW